MSKTANSLKLMIVIYVLIFCGCAEQRPIFYPNAHLNQVGYKKAQADIDACIRLAKNYGAKEDVGGRIAKDTAASAAVGAAAGAAIGAVLGNNVGRAAGVGAAGAGTATFTRKAIDSGKPGPVFRRYVEKCLREKGYEIIGWR